LRVAVKIAIDDEHDLAPPGRLAASRPSQRGFRRRPGGVSRGNVKFADGGHALREGDLLEYQSTR
jgi:hypothetical protein